MDIKVSIIVPVYNVENYLHQCIDSIITQSLKEIEIICVDDGSTDSSSVILDEYAKKDERIIVIHKENSGYGHTMNIGIDTARGSYIGIVESDDFIEYNMFEVLYNKAVEHNLDQVKSEYFKIYDTEDNKIAREEFSQFEVFDMYNKVFSPKELTCEFLLDYEIPRVVWSNLYNRNYIKKNNIRFNETAGASYQDIGFTFMLLLTGDRVMLIPDRFYHYRITNPASSMNNTAKIMAIYDEYSYTEKYIKEQNISNPNIIEINRFCCVRNWISQFYRIDEKYMAEMANLIKEYIDKNEMLLYKITSLPCDIHKFYYNTEWFITEMKYNRYCSEQLRLQSKIKASNLKKLTEDNEVVIIYGAGLYGENLYKKFSTLKLQNSINYYAVTKINTINELKGIVIKEISELVNYANNSILIIAGSDSNVIDMLSTAKKLGFKNIVNAIEFL